MKLQINIMSKLEESTENIQKVMMEFLIFQTKEDQEDLKETWSKTCMMVSKQ